MIHEYSQFFIKKSFDLPEYRKKTIKRKPIAKDYLFYSFFCKINNLDITSFDTYNEKKEKTILAEKIDKLKFKHKDFIMNNLMYDTNIALITLDILCKHYNTSIIFLKERIYIELGLKSNNKLILCMNERYDFIIYDPTILNTYYEVLYLDKPLYAVSHYKIADLIDICKKLYLPYEGLKKQLLYDSIYNSLVNLNIYKID